MWTYRRRRGGGGGAAAEGEENAFSLQGEAVSNNSKEKTLSACLTSALKPVEKYTSIPLVTYFSRRLICYFEATGIVNCTLLEYQPGMCLKSSQHAS